VKAANLYYDEEFMAMTTNLYHQLLVCKGLLARNSFLVVALHVILPLCLAPPFLVAHVFFFHNSTHMKFKTYTHKQKKTKPKNKETTKTSNKDIK
jgi:quinol-cytochrome oxidoreductase complex cytochrome b subunit